ncbi:MDR family MFS transporter [Catellatospora sp. KI3]|uniref:MDR family MFS transporter n=1 Tax=Catellatospora sp. KI3 TaxID=3041620 RepID=UPI00248230DC|nr:MDR family MFS transporter [Catellatospora sp. KI3]MDI1459790.1 MDR family MFS transporter [Catellatospora sp. KI3]
MLAILLAMLDNMIVGTAMPRIVGELGGLDKLSWVVTAYVLGTTISTPIWGKLGDLYGRKTIFMVSIVIFLVGSALSGAAGEIDPGSGMTQLIAFRALQGLGGGGLMVGAMAIIGDLVPPRERGKYQGMMAAIMGIAMIGGPLIGGFITDHADWRWAFYINLPIGGVALLVLASTLHLPKYRTEHRIDWIGAALLSVGVTALVLITTWGGDKYAWGSKQIIGLAVVGVVLLAIFLWTQTRVAEPILPLGIFRNRNFSLVSIIGFMVGFAMFGAISFLPLYMQTVQGASATNSGLLLLPMMLGMMVTSVFAGRTITRTGRYRAFPIVGGVTLALAMYLLTRLDADTSRTESSAYMVLLGVGMGFLMQTTMLIAQNSVDRKDLGVSSSTATFVRSIGGSFGVSLFGAVFVNRLKDYMTDHMPAGAGGGMNFSVGELQPTELDKLPAAAKDLVVHAIAFATSGLFWWALGFAILVPVAAWFIKEVPLRGHDEPAGEGAEAEARPLVAID